MAYIIDAELKTRLVACLQQMGLDTAATANWDVIITDANLAAQNEIKAALVAQGYTAAQAADWDRAREFNIDLGLFWCLVKGGVTQAYDDKFIRDLDRREELKSVVVLIDDEIPEDDDSARGIAFGMLTNENDVFSMDDAV